MTTNDSEEAVYTIEKIVGHRFSAPSKGKGTTYIIKWHAFAESENTEEEEHQILGHKSIVEYWRKQVTVAAGLGEYGFSCASYVFIKDYLQQIVLYLTFKDNSRRTKLTSRALSVYKWKYMIKAFSGTKIQHSKLLANYQHQLNLIGKRLEGFPCITVVNNQDMDVPVPIRRLIFTTITSDQVADYDLDCENHLLKDDEIIKFAFDDIGRITSDPFDTLSINRDLCAYQPKRLPLYLMKDQDNYWFFKTRINIAAHAKIMPIGGVAVLRTVAHKCLAEDGELVAHNCFIDLENGKSLDRRFLTDLSIYFHHSCDSNCKLIQDGFTANGDPQLYIVSSRFINQNEKLTLDRYEFIYNGKQTLDDHMNLSEKKVDHVLCNCGSPRCRVVLWQAKTASSTTRSDGTETFFGGLKCLMQKD